MTNKEAVTDYSPEAVEAILGAFNDRVLQAIQDEDRVDDIVLHDHLRTSARCLEAIKKRWISWAGNPSTVQCDRGLHNRGVLAQYMSAQGIQVYHAPLKTPEAIGRVERHGGVLKGMAMKVISQTQARGEAQIQSFW